MLVVNDGAEYKGERYISCWKCPSDPMQAEVLFEGTSIEELDAFLLGHREHA